uniref:Alcohol dehydrogenase n=1 Tax=Ignisphaera aggregans TaxID=334771 RepID=A0A7C5Z0S2_9CREN
MRAIVINKPFEAYIKDVDDPKPGVGEVLVSVKACGVCGTDIHIFRGEESRVSYPIVPGHEFSGVVVDVGSDVGYDVSVGDSVVVDPNVFCGECYYCRRGYSNYCERWEGIGVTRDGGMAEKVVVPAKAVYRIPKDISFDVAALAEPISCILHGIDLASPYNVHSIAIFGAGPIGLIFLILLKRFTSAKIAVFEVARHRIDMAKVIGADIVENPLNIDIAKIANEVSDGRGFDMVIDASGNIDAISRILKLDFIAPTGKILLFGVAPPNKKVEIEPHQIYRKEVKIIGSYVNPYTMYRAIDVLKSIKEFNKIIDRIDLEEALSILKGKPRRQYIKPVIVF